MLLFQRSGVGSIPTWSILPMKSVCCTAILLQVAEEEEGEVLCLWDLK